MDVEWMFGDAAAGAFARLNPLRWSGSLGFDEAVKDMRKLLDKNEGHRAIIVKIPSGMMTPAHKCKNVAEAIEYIKAKDLKQTCTSIEARENEEWELEKQPSVCTDCYGSNVEPHLLVSKPAATAPTVPSSSTAPTAPTVQGDSATSSLTQTATPSSKQSQQQARISVLRKRAVPLDDLHGDSWNCLVSKQPKLAQAIQACQKMCAADHLFDMESEAAFQALRRGIRSCPQKQNRTPGEEVSVSLDALLGKPSVWHFLDLMEARRPIYKAQVAELKTILNASPPWVDAKLT